VKQWLHLARQPRVVHQSLKVSLVVGTLLVLINHGDAFLLGTIGTLQLLKIALTYLVPYGVTTYAAVETMRDESGPKNTKTSQSKD